MFDQNDNQQNGQDFLSQISPAPGSAGPVSDDDAPAAPSNDSPFDTAPAVAAPAAAPATDAPHDSDALLAIKQDALQTLAPLVGHLEQSPEEKFRTTMMMIQASDDQTLLKDAYEAAKGITDEKTRAQALLDVVNEINYFTQQHHN